MRKRFVFGALAVLGLGIVAALVTFWLTDPTQDRPSDLTEQEIATAMRKQWGSTSTQVVSAVVAPIDLSHPIRLAIGGLGLGSDEKNRNVADLAVVALNGAAGLDLVARQSLDAELREMHLSLSGLVRAQDAVRVGKLLRVDWFLLGSSFTLHGTNSVIVRVVDARTGIMREAGVFPSGQTSSQLASDLAGFIRQCRQDAAVVKAKVYLALGTFQDLSLNNRLADFPAQLRSHLTAAYQGENLTLLEREFVSTLLNEVRLDLAGLTDIGTNTPSPMQSAFWLVDGYYQSYETSEPQVELVLNVQRILGRKQQTTVRAKPEDALFKQVKAAVDEIMKGGEAALYPTRMTELKVQLNNGRELLEAVIKSRGYNHGYDWIGFTGELSVRDVARLRRNTEEAIRAFETVLLLDPNHREAKIRLAACFQKPFIQREAEARELYREIIEEAVNDQWTDTAQRELVWGLEERSGAEAAQRWFQSALKRNTNKSRTLFYRQHLETAVSAVVIQRGNSPKAIELAKKRLLERIRLNRDFLERNVGSFHPDYGMDDFAEAFNGNQAETARALVEFLPQMKAEFPEMIPYVLAALLDSQTDPNGPVAVEFERVLDDCIESPGQVFQIKKFWQDVRWSVYGWCFAKTNYALAVKLMEGQRQAAIGGYAGDFNDQEKIKLAYAYLATERWRDALEIFDGFSNRLFRAEGGGPWGRAFVPILTDKLAAQCREKLGQTTVRDPREFDMGGNCLCLHVASTFAADAEGLWVGIAGQLLRLDFDLKTNRVVQLPVDSSVPISSLHVGSQKIWIGTAGAGLVECDKTTRQCRRLTEADGLMMDSVTSLLESGDQLWIGFGEANGGGLGLLDLHSGKIKSFMPSLQTGADEVPPRQDVRNIALTQDGGLRMLTGHAIRVFHSSRNSWETLPNKAGQYVACLVANSDCFVAGVNIGPYGRSTGGLEIQTLRDSGRQSLVDAAGLPNAPTAMTLEGTELWLGGEGFISLVDLRDCRVRKFSHIRARTVDQIQVGGGYVWARFDNHLHRIARN